MTAEEKKVSKKRAKAKSADGKTYVGVQEEMRVAWEAAGRPGGSLGKWLEDLGFDALMWRWEAGMSEAAVTDTLATADLDHHRARERQLLVEAANPRINSECPCCLFCFECCFVSSLYYTRSFIRINLLFINYFIKKSRNAEPTRHVAQNATRVTLFALIRFILGEEDIHTSLVQKNKLIELLEGCKCGEAGCNGYRGLGGWGTSQLIVSSVCGRQVTHVLRHDMCTPFSSLHHGG